MSEIIYLKDILKANKKKSIKKEYETCKPSKKTKIDKVKSSLVKREKKEDMK